MSATTNRVSVGDHEQFLASFLTESDRDELEETGRDLDEMIVCDPHVINPASRRSKRELNRVLAILDSIKNGRGE